MKRKYLVGIDVGGTKILVLLLDKNFRVRQRLKMRFDANKGEKHFYRILTGGIEELVLASGIKKKQIGAIGVGCAGMVRTEKGVVSLSPNIRFMKNYPLGPKLRKSFGVPALVENDVNAGLFGEHQFGSARGYDHVAGIFPGTGVGGALICHGKLYRGAFGMAGEVGHMFLSLADLVHGGPYRGTLENMIGRTTIASEAAALAARQRAPHLYSAVGSDVRKIKSKVLAKSIKAGDTEVRQLLLFKARTLGLAMANLVNIMNPELIVLGGGLIEAMGKVIVSEARNVMKRFAQRPNAAGVKVKTAALGDDAVAMGAAKLAFDAL